MSSDILQKYVPGYKQKLYPFSFEWGGGGEVEVEMCLTFHLLISLCMQTTKALKRLLGYAFDQAFPADIYVSLFL